MTPWVSRLIFANVAMFLVQMAVPRITYELALVPAIVWVRPWTVVTYMFLHGGLMHLLFNMIGLYFFGPRIEERIGSRRFLWLYLISGLAGAALSLVFELGNARISIIGASGATFGIFLAFARYWPHDTVMIWGIIPVPARILVILMAVLSIYGGFGGRGGGIAHFAHLGGFVGGWLYLKWMERRSGSRTFKQKAAGATKRSILSDGADLRRWESIDRDGLHPINREELDRILDKITATGVSSLTADERAYLDRLSRK